MNIIYYFLLKFLEYILSVFLTNIAGSSPSSFLFLRIKLYLIGIAGL